MSGHSIPKQCEIYQFFIRIGLVLFLRFSVILQMIDFVKASTNKGYNGSISDIIRLSYATYHRTTFGKMLANGNWNHDKAWSLLRDEVLSQVSIDTNHKEPLIAILDDTLAEKTKPSSRAKRTIQGTGYHQSHIKGKQKIWGHQLLAMMLCRGTKVLPFYMERYEKGGDSKITRACEMIESLPDATSKAYVLCDSWYTNEDIITSSFSVGFYVIGAMKTNRIIYPQGIRISIQDFAKHVNINDVRPVTVNKTCYLTYRYEGNLNGIENAVVIFTWLKKNFGKPGALHAFLSTDVSISTEEILKIYSRRWPIEIFFRNSKSNLGLDKYRIRSLKAIDRLLLMISISYTYCCLVDRGKTKFNNGIKKVRAETEKSKIRWIYEKAQQGIPVEHIFDSLKIA